MTIPKAVATVVVCTLLLAGVGGGVGYGIGTFAPGYYRSVVRGGREPGLDPVEVGVGLGVTQGTVAGGAVGLVLVAIFCFRETYRPGPLSPAAARTTESRATARRLLLTSVVLLALGGCTSAGVLVGCVAEELRERGRRFVEERDALAPAVERDPAFVAVHIFNRTDRGGVWLEGHVPTAGDLERLREIVVRGIGEGRAGDAVKHVYVRR